MSILLNTNPDICTLSDIYPYVVIQCNYAFKLPRLHCNSNNKSQQESSTPINPPLRIECLPSQHLFTTCPYMDQVSASRHPLLIARAAFYETAIRYAEMISYAAAGWS